MSYRFQSDAPMDVDAFTTAAFRQPQGVFLRRAYWSFQAWTLLLMAFVLVGAVGLGALLVNWIAPGARFGGIVLSLLPILIAVFVWFRFNASLITTMYRRMLDSPLYDGPITYEVSEKGFSMQSGTALWSVDWPAMDKVTKHPKGIFMYAGGFIYVIPRAVPPGDLYDPMWADIKRWFEAVR